MEKIGSYIQFINEAKKVWTEESIAEFIGPWNVSTFEKDFNKVRAALWLLELTLNRNPGWGFNKFDIETGMKDVTMKILKGDHLNEIEMSIIRSKIQKYVGQLTKLSNSVDVMSQGTTNKAYAWVRRNWSNYPENSGKPLPPKFL